MNTAGQSSSVAPNAMNLLQVVPAIARQSSGPSYSVVRLCESLCACGAGVQLAALDWEPLEEPPTVLRAFPLGRGPRRLGRSPKMRAWLIDQARSASLIHNHGTWQMNSIYPSVAARRAGIPLVTSPRGSYSEWAMASGSRFKRIFWPLVQRPAVEQTTLFHATSEGEYHDIRRLGFRQPVAIIPNGIDIPDQVDGSTAHRRQLLFLGRVHQVKGLDLLLAAWQQIQDEASDWDLVIAGSDHGYHGPTGYLQEMKQLADQLQLQRVSFIGEVTGERKHEVFCAAELFVLPSHSENFGVAVAESLARATPAVVSHGAPWSGLAAHDAGWHIPIGAEPLADCLREALRQPREELAAKGRAGRTWMQREFAWPVLGQRMLAVYEWLCGRKADVPECVRIA